MLALAMKCFCNWNGLIVNYVAAQKVIKNFIFYFTNSEIIHRVIMFEKWDFQINILHSKLSIFDTTLVQAMFKLESSLVQALVKLGSRFDKTWFKL